MRTALREATSYQLLAISLLFILFIVSFFVFTIPAKAAATFPWDAPSQSTFTLTNLIISANTGILGTCMDKNGSIQTLTEEGVKIKACSEAKNASAPNGAINLTMNVLSSLYNPPTSSVYYLANLGESIGIGPDIAYAQVGGSGQGIVAPVFKLWQVSRNLAYLVFIVVFVVVGFMVMFRQKLNPQTVIGVQQAIPGLIVGLLLVTFSYFIASFIVDLAFVGIQLVAQFFTLAQGSGPPNPLGDINTLAKNASVFELFGNSAFNGKYLGTVWQGTSGQLVQITGGNGLTSFAVAGGVGAAIGSLLGPFGAIGGFATGALAIPVIVPALVCLILLVALFIQMFKLLFALLKAYISILIMTLAGPFFILAGSIPGKSNAVSNWIKNLLANVLIFPAVFAAFLFVGVILGDTESWKGATTLPLFGGLDQNFVRVLIAYGILLGIPGIPDAIKGAFGVKDQNPITQAAMGGAMGGFNVSKAGANRGSGYYKEQAQAYGKAATEFRGGGRPAGPVAGQWRNWYRIFGVRKS